MGQGRGNEATEAVFAYRQKSLFIHTGCHYLLGKLVLCICQCMSNIRRFYFLRGLDDAGFYKPGIHGSGRV